MLLMNLDVLMRRLSALRDTPHERGLDAAEVEASVAYLSSGDALASLDADSYWPKWHSPWWHMLLLAERGEAGRIPPAASDALLRALQRLPLKIFPIHEGDVPAGLDAARDSSCHCALGCIVPVLLACGIDVDATLPWARDWFVRYQMKDGGLNCDDAAYRCTDETPSSMVGTVPPLEAMLALTERQARPEDLAFVHRAAAFLIERALVRGCRTVHNAEERLSEPAWRELCFPRFYFYDVLRGLDVLVAWAQRFQRPLAVDVVAPVVDAIATRFPDGQIRICRRPFEGKRTRMRSADGAWTTGHPASTFALLQASSRLGDVSPPLSRRWSATRARLCALADTGLLQDTPRAY
jgi:hypothetical protein